jgi:hypothetical protein
VKISILPSDAANVKRGLLLLLLLFVLVVVVVFVFAAIKFENLT